MKNLSFSQRHGYQPVKDALQIEDIDEDLRNGLWNVLKTHYWDSVRRSTTYPYGLWLPKNPEIQSICKKLWHDFFKKPLDTLSQDWQITYEELRKFYFGAQWYEVYDFIEFIAQNYPSTATNQKFFISANTVLEKELSGYRFVNGILVKIIDHEEVVAIEEASQSHLTGPRSHLKRALELLADRKEPDYRNSIKESISAVEALCRDVTSNDSATLSQALKELERGARLHPALSKSFQKLYGYTSDESGIRHALLESSSVGFDEAKFMLVACSAFVNFMYSKSGAASDGT